MRSEQGGTAHLAGIIEEDLTERDTGLYKPQRIALADLAASALSTRSANTGEWVSILPREGCGEKSCERYISRFLANRRINPLRVMFGFVPEILSSVGSQGQIVILMLDQSKISDGFECLMVSLRLGERAIPIAWRVIETKGAIGFDIQKPLLDRVFDMVPTGIAVLLAADRFYGTSNLIAWCQEHQWRYRIRLKGNLILIHSGGEILTGEAATQGLSVLYDARLGKTITHIGIIHEAGHPEPWIIAMNERPNPAKILDYGMRWGIEALFSDIKSRGFGVTKTQLKDAKRIEKLLLVLAIATYWAVSTGMTSRSRQMKCTKKNKHVRSSLFSSKGFEPS
jgi:Transposase DDE domain